MEHRLECRLLEIRISLSKLRVDKRDRSHRCWVDGFIWVSR